MKYENLKILPRQALLGWRESLPVYGDDFARRRRKIHFCDIRNYHLDWAGAHHPEPPSPIPDLKRQPLRLSF